MAKHVGKQLAPFIAAARKAGDSRDEILAAAVARFGCSRQTARRALAAAEVKPSPKPAPARPPGKRPAAPAVEPRRRLPTGRPDVAVVAAVPAPAGRRERFLGRVSQLAGEAYDREEAALASRLEDRVAGALAPIAPEPPAPAGLPPGPGSDLDSGWGSDPAAGKRPAEVIRRVEQLPPRARAAVEPEPDLEPEPRAVRDSTPRAVREEPVELLEESRRSAPAPASGRAPSLGMRSPAAVSAAVAAAAVRGPSVRRANDDLAIAQRVPRLSGEPLAKAIERAEGSKHVGAELPIPEATFVF